MKHRILVAALSVSLFALPVVPVVPGPAPAGAQASPEKTPPSANVATDIDDMIDRGINPALVFPSPLADPDVDMEEIAKSILASELNNSPTPAANQAAAGELLVSELEPEGDRGLNDSFATGQIIDGFGTATTAFAPNPGIMDEGGDLGRL